MLSRLSTVFFLVQCVQPVCETSLWNQFVELVCGTSLWNQFVEPVCGNRFVESICGTNMRNQFVEPICRTRSPVCGVPGPAGTISQVRCSAGGRASAEREESEGGEREGRRIGGKGQGSGAANAYSIFPARRPSVEVRVSRLPFLCARSGRWHRSFFSTLPAIPGKFLSLLSSENARSFRIERRENVSHQSTNEGSSNTRCRALHESANFGHFVVFRSLLSIFFS